MSNPRTEIPRAVDILTRLVRATANADTLHGALKGVDTLCFILAAITASGDIAVDMITSRIISSVKDITTDLDEGRELGKTYTHAAGVFVFRNVALGTSYRLVPTPPLGNSNRTRSEGRVRPSISTNSRED